ncbi:MAG TPA: YtxH domain-containing protein [Thermoleophilia bacterium]|nr:YtxH domain-containing protein [Thermoleophilia bacterium]
MKVLRFLLGLVIGAGVALLFAPKSGRELRQQLVGGAAGTLLEAAPDDYPQPEPAGDWAGPASVVAEAPVEIEEEPIAAAEPVVETPSWETPPEAPAGDDLRERIDETRAAVESELAEPFADDVAEAAVEEAVVSEEVAEEAIVEAAVSEIVAEEAVEEAVVSEEVAEEAAVEAAAAALVVEAAAVEAEVAEEVAVEAVVEAAAAEIVAEESVAEAIVDEVVAEEAVVEAAVDEAVAEEAVVEAAVEEVVAEEAAPKEPSPREGGGIDQAEMRRRIEETRARLKAKAFDAMMSGEAALLSRDSGEKPVPTADDAGLELDAETDNVIDESLSQEDY